MLEEAVSIHLTLSRRDEPVLLVIYTEDVPQTRADCVDLHWSWDSRGGSGFDWTLER